MGDTERKPDYNNPMPDEGGVCTGSTLYCVLSTEPPFDTKQVHIWFTSAAFENESKSPPHARRS
jgi:hypothetical protein